LTKNLEDICTKAMTEGRKIDLTGCFYGETTGCCTFLKRPTNYYYFLAGFVKTLKLTKILEIGTHFGGSIISMARAIDRKDILKSTLVTVDITYKNEKGFKDYPYIKRIQSDSLDKGIIRQIIKNFDEKIDLLYIDSLHEYGHTKRNIDIYGQILKPRYIILDDIRQCDSMQRLWIDLKKEYGSMAFDASEISVRKGAGFGVIEWRK